MEWIENLKEPINGIDVLCGVAGYFIYKWVMIAFEIGKKIYKNVKEGEQ